MTIHAKPWTAEDVETTIYELVRAHLRFVPKPVREAYRRLMWAKTEDDIWRLEDELRDICVELSRAQKGTDQGWGWTGTEYCECVLCKASVANKSGIEDKHLQAVTGTCAVWRNLIRLARLSFREREQQRAQRLEEGLRQARKTGWVYLTDILNPPNDISVDARPWRRTGNDRKNAERRLISLGFEKRAAPFKGAIKTASWVRETDSAVILADPRDPGRILIRAWPLSWLQEIPEHARQDDTPSPSEEIRDTWKNDLEGKLMKRVDALLNRLAEDEDRQRRDGSLDEEV